MHNNYAQGPEMGRQGNANDWNFTRDKKSPEIMKSFSKKENLSASKDAGKTRAKLIRKQSSKRRVRPSSHRRIIRAKDKKDTEVGFPSF